MMQPAAAERITGFKVGGISPFGQKRKVPTAFEGTALADESIFTNGGQRGSQVQLAPKDACAALAAVKAALISR